MEIRKGKEMKPVLKSLREYPGLYAGECGEEVQTDGGRGLVGIVRGSRL